MMPPHAVVDHDRKGGNGGGGEARALGATCPAKPRLGQPLRLWSPALSVPHLPRACPLAQVSLPATGPWGLVQASRGAAGCTWDLVLSQAGAA